MTSSVFKLKREPCERAVQTDMPVVCSQVEWVPDDAPPIVYGNDYSETETPDVAPLGWPMAVALACGAGLALYAALAFCWWVVTG